MEEHSQYHDDLTGALNRRYLSEQLMGELTARIAGQRPFTLSIIDIDRFKDINDTYGHLRGDNVIKKFVIFLKQSFRGSDVIIRYGGDEFVCVMNDTLKRDAESVLNRIAESCRQQPFDDLSITFSAGIAAFPGDGGSYEEVFASVDRALYDAKRAGRDRISTVGEKKAELPIKVFIDRMQEKESMRMIITGDSQRLRAVVVHGLVGVGKTRLSRELLTGLKEREIIWTDCIQFDEPLAYYVIRELIRYRLKRFGPGLFNSLPTAYLLEIGKLIPELISDVKDVGIASEVMDRYRLYESVRKVLDMGLREKIIIIDNIQWIDAESLEVLKYVIRAMSETPLTMIFLHRTEEVSEPVEDFLAFVSREFETRHIQLAPFGRNETREAIRAVISEEPSTDFIDYVLKESGGVPLYIEEIIRDLLERSCLCLDQGEWRFAPPAEAVLPGSITDVALKKYRSLSREAQQVLDIATILGWFETTVIREITGFNEGHVMGLISEINRLGMIRYLGDRYEFSAAVNRNAIYRRYVKGPRSAELHRQVATRLERLHLGHKADFTEDLAYHFYLCRDARKAVDYCRQAGDRARLAYANRDALRFYSWAVELLGPDPVRRRERLEMMLKKAEVLTFTGKTQEALDLIGSMRQDMAELQDREFETSVLTLLMKIHVDRAQYDKVLEIGNELFGHYGREVMFTNKPEVLSFLSRAFYRQGHYEPALTHLTEALKICLDTRDEAAEAKVRINLGNVHHSMGDHARALENYERCLDIHRRHNTLDGEARILTNLSIVYGDLGQTDRGLESVRRAAEIFHLTGNRIDEARALNNLGSIYERDGRFEEARSLYERALKNHREIGNKEGVALVSLNLGNTYRNHDQDEKGLAILQDALQNAREVKSKNLIAAAYLNEAYFYLDQRQFDRIEGIFDEIIKGSEVSQELAVGSFSFLCDYFLTIGDEPRFLDALDSLSGLAKSGGIPMPEAHLRYLRGRYELNRGNLDQAYEDLRRGLEIYQQLHDRSYVALSYYFLARLEMARGNEPAYRDNINRAKQEFAQIKWSRWLNILAKEESGDKEVVQG
jgi:diguanylate cyclase (GGDEF)-like protein